MDVKCRKQLQAEEHNSINIRHGAEVLIHETATKQKAAGKNSDVSFIRPWLAQSSQNIQKFHWITTAALQTTTEDDSDGLCLSHLNAHIIPQREINRINQETTKVLPSCLMIQSSSS
jgi:hypothetical protein